MFIFRGRYYLTRWWSLVSMIGAEIITNTVILFLTGCLVMVAYAPKRVPRPPGAHELTVSTGRHHFSLTLHGKSGQTGRSSHAVDHFGPATRETSIIGRRVGAGSAFSDFQPPQVFQSLHKCLETCSYRVSGCLGNIGWFG